MQIILTDPPTTYLATLDQLKTHLRIPTSEEEEPEDQYLIELLEESRDFIEAETRQIFTSQVWTQYEHYLQSYIWLGKQPVSEVEIKYYDKDNVQQTLDEEEYYIWFDKLIPVTSWPSTYTRHDAVAIEMTCGPETVPPIARATSLAYCAFRHENRGDEDKPIPAGIERTIRLMRRNYIA